MDRNRNTLEETAKKSSGTEASAVMLLDGSKSVQAVLRRILELGGHRVLAAGCGREALRLLARHPVDLIVADLPMSDLDGIEVLMWLRQARPGLPIIAMSADETDSADDYLAVARMVGVQFTLPKPFGAIELLAAVQQVLSESRAIPRRTMAVAFDRLSATPFSNEESPPYRFAL